MARLVRKTYSVYKELKLRWKKCDGNLVSTIRVDVRTSPSLASVCFVSKLEVQWSLLCSTPTPPKKVWSIISFLDTGVTLLELFHFNWKTTHQHVKSSSHIIYLLRGAQIDIKGQINFRFHQPESKLMNRTANTISAS